MFDEKNLLNITPGLRQFALKLCGNRSDAEDLTQNTVLKALENKDKFREGSDLFSWTSKIMYNHFVSGYRRKVKHETQYDPDNFIRKESRSSRQENIVKLGRVNEAINELSPEHKRVVELVCFEAQSYQSVSEILDIPIGTVRSRLSRARKELTALLDMNKIANANEINELCRIA